MLHLKNKIFIPVCLILFGWSLLHGSAGFEPDHIVTPGSDPLLGRYEKGDREFSKYEIGNMIVYFHQRSLNGAVVEKDFTVYQFDKNTRELLMCRVNRRDDVPGFDGPLITRAEAEAMVAGDIIYSRLLFISPESDVFPLETTPCHPCWIIAHNRDGSRILSVIDCQTGEYLGMGISPPDAAYSFSGPTDSAPPCSGSWGYWISNAKNWFADLGYSSTDATWPAASVIKNKVQDTNTGVIYEFGHGGSDSFLSACRQYTSATNVENWMAAVPKKTFVFLGHCEGMCETGDNTLSYEYRKGSLTDTVTLGYCHMAESYCASCWSNSLSWQDRMFYYIYHNYTIKSAFDQATADYPMCYNCVRCVGDATLNLKLVPPAVTLTVVRKIEYFWTERKHYAQIDLNFKNEDSGHFPRYKLYRREAGGQYAEIKEITGTNAASVDYSFLDDLPDNTKSYTYRVGILDPRGIVAHYSAEVTINPL